MTDFAAAREAMVREQLAERGITDKRVLDAMRTVPRHAFVPEDIQHMAYADRALPIGANQTISQPYMVAVMTALLQVQSDDRVLEIGVGSGYQTAVLATICDDVLGIERIPQLAERAAALLDDLGITNVEIMVGDGTQGAPAQAPFDAILVAAAGPTVPQPLVDQLARGGRLVLPVGEKKEQTLIRLTRKKHRVKKERLFPVRFVPLIGEHGLDL